MFEDAPDSGWSLVAQEDEAAALLGGLLDLEPDVEYTKSDLAEESGVPLKTLYLVDTLEDFVSIGVLERVETDADDAEACYAINGDSEVLATAREFDEVVAERLDPVSAE